jgi:hypothetical protein
MDFAGIAFNATLGHYQVISAAAPLLPETGLPSRRRNFVIAAIDKPFRKV